jgi:hypothetical protein
MTNARLATDVLRAGMATGIGSLPHHDAVEAAACVLRCLPELPYAPQLPRRSPAEGLLAPTMAAVPDFTMAAHAGLLTFLDVAAAEPVQPRCVKVQLVGPLTLGVAFLDEGSDVDHAFARSVEACSSWALAMTELVADRLPGADVVLFLDEPSLVLWRDYGAPLARGRASACLSSVIAATPATAGVHVCGRGNLSIAVEAEPAIVHVDIGALEVDDAAMLGRFLEGDGWIAWGAVPTDGPIAAQSAPLWERLVGVWSLLAHRGCDPGRMRSQALVAPACGLVGHDLVAAERAMSLARELGERVRDAAAAPAVPT